jgi:uncharacterized membrane protein
MKYGIYSIIIALIGITFVIWFNIEVAELFESEFLKLENQNELSPTIFTTGKINKITALVIGIVGLLFGIKSLRDKNRIGIFGILLSIILIILTFVPIWQYMLSNSALDINFVN